MIIVLVIIVLVIIVLVIIVLVVVVFVVVLEFILGLRGRDRAIGGGRRNEQRQRLFQLGEGLGERGLVGVAFRRVLEADDVGARNPQRHVHGVAFDGDVEAAMAVLMGIGMALVFGLRTHSTQACGAQKGGEAADRHGAVSVLDGIS